MVLSGSILSRITGTNVNSFRLAEAITKEAGLGLAWRLDAAKDVMDQDAVRNGDVAFDESWQNMIDFWKKFVQSVKSENPDAYIVAELTDIADLMRDTLGENTSCYDNMPDLGFKFKTVPDAMLKFFNETGITSEAAYSYFFTDMLKVFACDFTNGATETNEHNRTNMFIWKLNELINDYSLTSNQKLINTTQLVLVEGLSSKEGELFGYTETNKLVNFKGNVNSIGKIVKVKILDAKSFSLDGEQVE